MTGVSRQAIFSGTETPPAHLELDREVVARILHDRLGDVGAIVDIEKFKGGQSNPTYLISCERGAYVLRRKPPGVLVQSAHAIDREFRVMQAMHQARIPVAQPYFYCEDERVIGSAFYVAEFVAGQVYWDAEMPGSTPDERRAVYDQMNAILVRLHETDAAVVGLADLGRPDNFAARNLKRWSSIYDQSRLVDSPDMDWLMQTLPGRMPPEARATLTHGDYGLYNMIVEEGGSRVLAVLDWEMTTLGDPFIDLAHHLRAWWDIPDELGAATSLGGKDLTALGIPTMEDYLALYCERRGIERPDMTWYLAYAQFRYAAMMQGILKRAADGTASSRTVLHRQSRVEAVAALARRTLTEG
jgi:aminoglycoside phosphotransferase (APT) family kinase protein